MHTDTLEAPHSTNGNGHSNGNGLSPSQKAWQTAKDRAVAESEARRAENSARWYAQREETLRAVTDKDLSHGAARLFVLLTIAGWEKDFGGLYRDRVGSIFIDGRRLAKLCGKASVNVLYRKNRLEKRDATGKILRSASQTTGWLEELIQGGYLWISKHRIPNIPPAKWPNVYNLCCHVPQKVTPNLPWTDGNFGSENVDAEGCSPRENRNFDASDVAGDRERAENPLASHRNGGRPVTAAEDRLSPRGIIGNHRSGGQAVTGTEDRQSPQRRTGNHRNGGQAVTAADNGQSSHAVQLRETVGGNSSVVANGVGDSPPQDGAWERDFKKWEGSLDKPAKFPRELKELLAPLNGERHRLEELAQKQAGAHGKVGPNTAEALRRVALKIQAINVRLTGPK